MSNKFLHRNRTIQSVDCKHLESFQLKWTQFLLLFLFYFSLLFSIPSQYEWSLEHILCAWLDANLILNVNDFMKVTKFYKHMQRYCVILIGNIAHFWLFGFSFMLLLVLCMVLSFCLILSVWDVAFGRYFHSIDSG